MEPIAIWGAFLSTVLAGVKLWELYSDRSRLIVSYSFASDPKIGNEVIIYNPTDIPVMINYWELVWISKRRCKESVNYGQFPDEGYCDITIPSHSKFILEFKNQNYFSWDCKEKKKGKIYIRLHIVGRRKPLCKLVYNPYKI